MKRFLCLSAMLLAFSPAVFANGISEFGFTNTGGTLTASSSGESLSGTSTLVSFSSQLGSDLGTVSFTTGALTSGSLQNGGTFGAGGVFQVYDPSASSSRNGYVIVGQFTSATWTLVTLANGTHQYTLTGAFVSGGPGVLIGSGTTIQLSINTGTGYFNGSAGLGSGVGDLVTPEPGSLGLVITGLLGIGVAARRGLRLAQASRQQM